MSQHCALRHGIPLITIFTLDAKINESGPRAYQGLDRYDARKAVLHDLEFDAVYYYRVTGPGLPAQGFASSFKTRTRSKNLRASFASCSSAALVVAMPPP